MHHEIKRILNDRESGSVGLLNRLIVALEFELGIKDLSLIAFTEDLNTIRHELKHFAAIENFLASLITLTMQKGAFPENALQFIRDYSLYWQDSERKIAENFLELCKPEGKTMLTHSHSHTVISLLEQIHLKRIPFRVLQTLSHPGEEGEKSFERMQELNIQAVLIEDREVKEALPQTDLILMGCDALLDNKFLNKLGTRKILEAAKHAGKPSFLLTESRKKITQADWESTLTNISIFEWVRLDLITGIVTERGI